MATRRLETLHKNFTIVQGPGAGNAGMWSAAEVQAAGIPASRVWTEIDPNVRSGMTYLLPGYCYVNRTHEYVVTEKPWAQSDYADSYRVTENVEYYSH